jgi:Putative inner membrane exporter, YdcZ
LLYALALGAGVSVVTQQMLNGSLRTALGSPAWAGLVSYAGGLLTMVVAVIALREGVPTFRVIAAVPWWAWSGGLFGGAFILLAILLLPSLGDAVCACHRRPGARRGDARSFRRVRADAASDQHRTADRCGAADRRRHPDAGLTHIEPADHRRRQWIIRSTA